MAFGKAARNNNLIPFKTGNKLQRQAYQLQQKKAKNLEKRKERGHRRKEEDQNPRLREERREKNVPITIDKKRTWDTAIGDDDDIGLSVDVQELKRRKEEEIEQLNAPLDGYEAEDLDMGAAGSELESGDEEEELNDFLNGEEDGEETEDFVKPTRPAQQKEDTPQIPKRQSSPSGSTTSTNFSLIPENLASKFPAIFDPPAEPKVLITTHINGTVHNEAKLLTSLFPNSTYVRRSAHRFAHKYSVKEISSFASNRGYTCVVVLEEWAKKPSGLTVVHLPNGPTFHFSISNWLPGARIPDHGNPTEHYPELILNNFSTPLGLITAKMFVALFPRRPELQGRQVVTLLNQRDYIFVRRHRYVFRDRRPTEKSIVGSDGKVMEGVEDIRTGLQEIGPRFTLKLRRIDKGIQRASGQEWEWKAHSEKQRTRFQL